MTQTQTQTILASAIARVMRTTVRLIDLVDASYDSGTTDLVGCIQDILMINYEELLVIAGKGDPEAVVPVEHTAAIVALTASLHAIAGTDEQLRASSRSSLRDAALALVLVSV